MTGPVAETTLMDWDKQLTINLDWYIKFEEKASAAYQNMLTE